MPTHHTPIIALLCVLPFAVYTQDYRLGMIADERADEAYQQTEEIPAFSGNAYTTPPPSVSLKKHAPPVKDQGDNGSCVGWSAAYAAYSIGNARRHGWTDADSIAAGAFSALYVYHHIKVSDCEVGAAIGDACLFLVEQGDLKSPDFDHSHEGCGIEASSAQRAAARQARIKEYYRLFDKTADPAQKVFKAKRALADGSPVVAGLLIRKNFAEPSADGFWEPESGNTAPWGGHAVCVVGYDDDRQAFEIMNSWGEEWGDGGYAWIRYADFGEYCRYGYQLVLHGGGGEKELSGAFTHLAVLPAPSGGKRVQSTRVRKTEGYAYELEGLSQRGDMFQLMGTDMRAGTYTYVFSVDGEGSAQAHWPRNARLGEQHTGKNDAPIIPSTEAGILIPGKGRALLKNTLGDDFLVILYSTDRIPDFQNLLKNMEGKSAGVEQNLRDFLGDRLLPANDIHYQNDRMVFRASAEKGVVPIILKAKGGE